MSQSTELQQFPVPPGVSGARGYQLTVIMRDGEPWFVGRDLCALLGIANSRDALSRLDPDQKGVGTTDTLGGQQSVTLVNESGMYALIFTSRRREAADFRRWVTGEVLPSIRKTGSYGVQRELTRKELLQLAMESEEAREAAEQKAAVALAEAEKLDRQLTATIGELGAALPKIEGYDAFLSTVGAFPLAVAASMLGTGRQKLIQQLAAWRVLMLRPGSGDHLRPYAEHIHEGRFTVKATDVAITHRDGSSEVITRGTTLVTPKGLDYIRRRQVREAQARPTQMASA